MSANTIILILFISLAVCLAAFIMTVAYFLYQWKHLDIILENYLKKDLKDTDNQDIYETRESKVLSQLYQILDTADFKQKRAIGEKNQVMELISDLSHQLKTPLANIVMDMELLQDDSLERKAQKEFLEHAKSQANKMQWLMNDLLKSSRLENGIINFDAENTGIKETIANAVSAVYAQAAQKQIQISVEEFTDFTLYHNVKWTAEALTNILENAIKYSPEKSCIQISISVMDMYSRITITDEGIGISEAEYNRIFQRFYRGKNTEHQDGNGLGLYLAQLILQCEKGYITVSSKIGHGSKFSIFLLNNYFTNPI